MSLPLTLTALQTTTPKVRIYPLAMTVLLLSVTANVGVNGDTSTDSTTATKHCDSVPLAVTVSDTVI